jgi:hypothetical protein
MSWRLRPRSKDAHAGLDTNPGEVTVLVLLTNIAKSSTEDF